MKRGGVCYLACLVFFSLEGKEYKKPVYVKEEVWQEVKPYFLPWKHPLREKLDKIFKKRRVIHDVASMEKAGFLHPVIRKWTKLVVVKHPDLKGFIVKTYLDTQKDHANKPEHYFWIKRIEGASLIRKKIEKEGWQSFFKVPKKWVYPLPENPFPFFKNNPKYFILVEEEMDILDKEGQKTAWKQQKVTEEFLYKLYQIIYGLGLKDASKPENIPFCKDGKVAFVDTQSFHFTFFNYERLGYYLKEDLQVYWRSLFEEATE